MNTLLLFFALPVATIILAIVLEKILRAPVLTAATFFAVYLILAFSAFDTDFLIFVIIYTILAYIAAVIAEIFFRRCMQIHNRSNNTATLGIQDTQNNNINRCNNNDDSNNNCSVNDVATVNVLNNTTGGRTCWRCYRRN